MDTSSTTILSPIISYYKQQRVCDSCKGKYTLKNKSHHIKTYKHNNAINPELTRKDHKKDICSQTLQKDL